MLLSTWTSKMALSPNTVISTLSTLGKAAMMLPVGESISQLKWLHILRDTARSVPRGRFTCKYLLIRFRPMHMQSFDDASRGPLGSVAFIWKGRNYGSLGFLTYVGCVLTIAAVALDPFAQQIISFPSKQTMVAGEALVKRSQVYDYGNKGWRGATEPGALTEDYDLDPKLSRIEPIWMQGSNNLLFATRQTSRATLCSHRHQFPACSIKFTPLHFLVRLQTVPIQNSLP